MKLHCSKILLLFLPLNIIVKSYQVHNKNKPYITLHTPHTPITTSRVLSEKDIQSSNYDNNPQMKSVMQQFVGRTSQRFEEYQERMKDKRQKRKEERDKNIQKIIEKDRREKSLTEKVEKGCLKCGCALGGGVLPVWGLVSGVGYAVWSQHATKLAIQKGIAEGLKVGLDKFTEIVTNSLSSQKGFTTPAITELKTLIEGKFHDEVTLHGIFKYISSNTSVELRNTHQTFFATVDAMAGKELSVFNNERQVAVDAVANAFKDAKAAEFAAKTGLLSNTIIASVVAIVVIVLIMVIIYLVLRYRRKKKMNKKAQYTKLLNQ
ncbi:rifin PIR protein,putative [Plasmodium sp. DRC-Itaito]|nr:rifin PIR protein,putative [Plasmodium sp. DRC-Itaito]